MFVLLLILIFIRPFISSLAFPYFNYLHSFLLLGSLLLWLIRKGGPSKDIASLRYPLILFISAIFVSVFFSQEPLRSIESSVNPLMGLALLAFGLSMVPEEKEKVIFFIVLSGLFVSALAIYQYAFGFKHLLDYVSKHNISDPFILEYIERKRAFLPFVTPNILGGYLAMVLPLTWKRKKDILFIALFALALLLTKSLSALLSIFVGVLVYFYFEEGLGRKKIIFISGFLIMIALVLMARIATQKEHLHPVFSTVMRLNYWRDTLRIIRAFPWTGVGLGNFDLTYSRYAHNSYLQIWAEMGILGLISFLWIIIRIFRAALSHLSIPEERNQTLCLMTAGFVFLAHNFLDFTFFLPEVSTLWWLILGLMISKRQTP
ncbi:MAG: hypothetical protein AMJ95_01065 [Omnitrophica WOR_2 bacterium SM23_72]|nr:MAG: hypothetical protein AMJ95_01065 [Omnitrophica WOR_2 bacterium SM23_72]